LSQAGIFLAASQRSPPLKIHLPVLVIMPDFVKCGMKLNSENRIKIWPAPTVARYGKVAD
jgi:hypothetical protein